METNPDLLQQTYQLAKENNRMLHAMRRHAFISGIIKLLVYAALLVIPFWLYIQYLSPQVDRILKTMNQIQGTGASAQAQMTEWQQTLKDLQGKLPTLPSTTNN
jgi:predicted PurR-regulated permease PerM